MMPLICRQALYYYRFTSTFLLFLLSSVQPRFVKFCQERRHGAGCKPLDQLPDRTGDEQPAHPSQCEPSGRAFLVGSHTLACSALHGAVHLCSQYASPYLSRFPFTLVDTRQNEETWHFSLAVAATKGED